MHPFARRITRVALATTVASLAATGAASAVTVVGSDLNRTPTVAGSLQDMVVTPTAPPDGALFPVTAPADGVVVRIRQRYGVTGATPGTLAFRILSGANPFTARHATVDGGELRLPLPANSAEGILDFRPVDALGRPVGIPIAAGERLAIVHEKQAGVLGYFLNNTAPGAAYVILVGRAHASGSETYRDTASRFELLLQAVIEPDADGDRLGDETQDQCPDMRNNPGTLICPSLTLTREVRVEVPVARCRVPLLRGLTRRFATRLLTASGCALGTVSTRTVRRGLRGRVIGQTARADVVLAAGAKVGVTLSRRAVPRRRR